MYAFIQQYLAMRPDARLEIDPAIWYPQGISTNGFYASIVRRDDRATYGDGHGDTIEAALADLEQWAATALVEEAEEEA